MSVSRERYWFSKSVIGLGFVMMAAGLAIAAWQAFVRIRDGYWTPYSVTQLFIDLGIPHPHGLGAFQRTIEWIMYAPATAFLAVTGCLLAGSGWLGRKD